ncbi:MAG: hypothetical protein AB1597_04135 [Chloroflexota bacterium]
MTQNPIPQTSPPQAPAPQPALSDRRKKAWISILSFVGLIVLLTGVLSPYVPWPWWLIIPLIFWIGSGILGRYWGVKK